MSTVRLLVVHLVLCEHPAPFHDRLESTDLSTLAWVAADTASGRHCAVRPPAGTFSSILGLAGECTPCDEGFTSAEGASQCSVEDVDRDCMLVDTEGEYYRCLPQPEMATAWGVWQSHQVAPQRAALGPVCCLRKLLPQRPLPRLPPSACLNPPRPCRHGHAVRQGITIVHALSCGHSAGRQAQSLHTVVSAAQHAAGATYLEGRFLPAQLPEPWALSARGHCAERVAVCSFR